MSRKKDSNPPEKPQADGDIHITPPEGLAEALEDSEALAERGKEALAEATNSSSIPPKARVVRLREDDEDDEEDEVDEDESDATEDLAEATGVFATSVDIITNALLVILGKFDESLKKQDRSNRRMSLILLLMVAVAVAMGWAVWRIESIAEQLHEARIAALDSAAKQREAAEEMGKLAKALQSTEKKVDEVKKEQEKQPDIAIEPDNKGGAKVVITPKKCDGDAKDCERKVTPPPATTGKRPPEPPEPKIEISIPGATATAPQTQGH